MKLKLYIKKTEFSDSQEMSASQIIEVLKTIRALGVKEITIPDFIHTAICQVLNNEPNMISNATENKPAKFNLAGLHITATTQDLKQSGLNFEVYDRDKY